MVFSWFTQHLSSEDLDVGHETCVYTYCPLIEPYSIRLIRLLPAQPSAIDIHCELLFVPISEAKSYTTLSYVWGQPYPHKSIFIAGKSFRVGPNLYSALRDLRRQDSSITIWVDAICINQEDLNERNLQVQQMQAIYSNSDETVIYLGPDDGTSSCRLAWDFLEYRSSWALNYKRDPDSSLPATRRKHINFRTAYSDVLGSVLSREWFNRIWVVQEVVVSRSLAIQCGGRRISWDDFCRTLFLYFHPLKNRRQRGTRAVNSLRNLVAEQAITSIRPGWEAVQRRHPNWKQLIQPVKELHQTRVLYQRERRNRHLPLPDWMLNDPLAHFITDDKEFRQGSLRLTHLLARCRKYQATDTRDKAFAILGISSLANLKSLIDYSKPDCQVYRDVTRAIMESEGTFDVLSQAGQISKILDFSSWAGQWSEPDFPPISVLSRLGGEVPELLDTRKQVITKHRTWLDDGRILASTGGIMGELVAMAPLDLICADTSSQIPLDLLHSFRECAITLLENSSWLLRSPGAQYHLSYEDMYDEGALLATVSMSGHALYTHLLLGGFGFLGDLYALQEGRMLGLIRSMRNRKELPETATYTWAAVPNHAKVGDQLASFTGCQVMLLVYSQSNDDLGDGRMSRSQVEAEMKDRLPPDGKGNANVIHCRLRGECRVNAFEDLFQLGDEVPVMTYIGYIPHEWTTGMFAVY